jgi:hypothetical protein
MKFVFLLFMGVVLMAGTCDSPASAAATFTIGETFTLAPGEESSNKEAGLNISFAEVLEDSRCPKNTNCVWEGQAKIKLMINDQAMELIIRAGKPEQAQQLYNNSYIIEAQGLSPYPDGTKIDPASYRLQLMVSSL